MYFSFSSIFSLDGMLQDCIVFKVSFSEKLTTDGTFSPAATSGYVLHNSIVIVIMTTDFALHWFNHLLHC